VLASDCELAANRKITDGRLKTILKKAELEEGLREPELQTRLLYAMTKFRSAAQEHFKTSHGCYKHAWRLDPDDARAMVEAAAVAIDDMDRRRIDREETRTMLNRARRRAGELRAAKGLGEERARELDELYADACEYLGIYYLEIEGDAAQALERFEEALAIAPQPDPALRTTYIPRCHALLQRR
jgi:tetratricopeptide (TPR) repeat protein